MGKRIRVAEAEILRLEKERAQVIEECLEVEQANELLVARIRRELTTKAAAWESVAQETEIVSQQKVADVKALTEKLKASLRAEAEASKARVDTEVAELQERLC